MELGAINLEHKLTLFTEHWSPKIIAQMNDYVFKLAKIQGEFIWHSHPETDEVFIVIEGSMSIEFHDGILRLRQGEMFVIPRGVEHKPVANDECHIMIIELAGTVNTGNVKSDRTIEEIWI